MHLNIIDIYQPLFMPTQKTRYVLLYGGRGRGGSTAGSQYAVFRAMTDPYCRAAVMREVLGTARSSIWQETKDRVGEYKIPAKVNDSNMTMNIHGNEISAKGFKKSSLKDKAKLKSLASYNLIIIDEADETIEEDFNQLDSSIRTSKGDNTVILIFNMPHASHWIVKRFFNLVQSEIPEFYNAEPKKEKVDTTYIFGTYIDNLANNSESNVTLYESYQKTNPDYYYSMIKGLVSEGKKGRIFKNVQYISEQEYNELDISPRYGLDFGFTNDPTALAEVKAKNNKVYVKELLYEKGLGNIAIANRIKAMGIKTKVVPDSSEPKSIEALKDMGINVEAAKKGQGSVNAGITYLQECELYIVETSENAKYEAQNYCYLLDKDKKPTNLPEDTNNHFWDAVRYAIEDLNKPKSNYLDILQQHFQEQN
jgi:phage terminase large subunit